MKSLPVELIPDVLGETALQPKHQISKLVRDKTNDGALMVDYLVGVLESSHHKAKDKIRAAEILLQRGYGKPESNVEINVNHQTRPLAEFTLEELERIAGRIVEGEFRMLEEGESEATSSQSET